MLKKHAFHMDSLKMAPSSSPSQLVQKLPAGLQFTLQSSKCLCKAPDILFTLWGLPHCRCDTHDIRTGKPRDPGTKTSTFQHAQKIRAAISHYYGRIQHQGMREWIEI